MAPTHSEHNRFSFIGDGAARGAHSIIQSRLIDLSFRRPYPLALFPEFADMKMYDNRCFPQHRMRHPIHTAVPFALVDISICQHRVSLMTRSCSDKGHQIFKYVDVTGHCVV